MQNNTIKLISGAYTSVLWETLENTLTNEDSLAHIHEVLKTLHDCGKIKVAFAFVQILYDIAGLALPDVVAVMDKDDDIRSAYITELLTDVENII